MDNTEIPATKKIVIIEDDSSLAEIYKIKLEALGYRCFIGYNGVTGLYFTQKEIPDLVLLDIMIPDIAGDKVLEIMRASEWGKDIKVLVMSNLNESEAPQDLRKYGIEDYIVKANISANDVDEIVGRILRPASFGAPSGSETAVQPTSIL